MAKKLLFPGQIHRSSVVRCDLPMEEGGGLVGEIKYIVETDYLEGDWSISLDWIDKNGQGHREKLPSDVVLAILRHTDGVRAELRKRRSRSGAETRKNKQLETVQLTEGEADES